MIVRKNFYSKNARTLLWEGLHLVTVQWDTAPRTGEGHDLVDVLRASSLRLLRAESIRNRGGWEQGSQVRLLGVW